MENNELKAQETHPAGLDVLIPLKKEIEELGLKLDKIRLMQIESFKVGSATRARTTTGNANADKINDRRIFLISELKKAIINANVKCSYCKNGPARNLVFTGELWCDDCLTKCSDF